MFTGTTPPEVKVLLYELMKGVQQKDVYIGCSGNYTTDKVMSAMGFRVHSNDVSLYSKLIADLVLGQDTTEVTVLNKDLRDAFSTWPDSRYKKLVEVMFAMRVSGFHEKKNQYQVEMYENFLDQSVAYYQSTIKKLEKGALDFTIADFYFGDFVEHLKSKRGKGVGISFPPTYKGGYEKIFAFVEESFMYDRAKYNMFDPKAADGLFLELLESDENIIYSDVERANCEKYLAGKVKLGPSKHPVFIYSSVGGDAKNYYIERKSTDKGSKIPILPVDYQFTPETKITMQVCSVGDVNYYKAFYMANKVNYTTGGDLGLAFLADGKAFGFATFSKQLSTIDEIFLQSDFVTNSETKKLSKLLIMLLKSHDVHYSIAKAMMNYYTSVKTTVYTDKPVSMKYRGIFDLLRRDKGKLMYVAQFTERTLQECYADWFKRFGGDKQNNN